MQILKLPGTTLHLLDKISRNFLWGSTNTKCKLHVVSWNQICKPLREGGLSIPQAKSRNLALIMALAWRFHTNSHDSLWARVLAAKYANASPSSYSPIWKSIQIGTQLCKQGTAYLIGDDSTISFWIDDWCGTPLRNLIEGPLFVTEQDTNVSHYIKNGKCDLDLLSFDMPTHILDKILSTKIPIHHQEDSVYWRYTPSGHFTTSSAYTFLLRNPNSSSPLDLWPEGIMTGSGKTYELFLKSKFSSGRVLWTKSTLELGSPSWESQTLPSALTVTYLKIFYLSFEIVE